MTLSTTPAAVPPSVRGRILPGWFDRDDAIRFLLDDCVFDPPIDASAAEALWRPYRERAEALPERIPTMPTILPLDANEQAHAKQFKAFINKLGGAVTDVVKLDPRQLGVIQYYVVTDQSDKYAGTVKTSNGWLKECLPLTERPPAALQIRYNQHQLNTDVDIDLPHAECVFAPVDPNAQYFSVVQFQRYVTVTPGLNRLYLTAGYHRCFARVSTTPAATAPTAVLALAANTLVAPAMPSTALAGVTGQPPNLTWFGRRAALLSDFFTDGLFMEVNLRRKRYRLQVRSTWVAVNA